MRHRGLGPRGLLTEVTLDLRHGLSVVLQFLVLIALISGVAVAEAATVVELVRAKESRQVAGESVMIAVTPDSAASTVADCASLADLDGIERVGAVTGDAIASQPAMGNARLVAAIGSPGLAELWTDGASGSSAPQVLGRESADRFGLQSTQALSWRVTHDVAQYDTGAEPTTRVIQFPRHEEAAGWLVLHDAVPDDPMAECWIESVPGMESAVESVVRFRLGSAAGPPVIRPLFRLVEGTSQDLPMSMARRSSRFAWIAAACLWTSLLAVQHLLTRRRLALYLSLGASRTELMVLSSLRQSLLVTAAAAVVALGASVGLLLHPVAALTRDVISMSAIQVGLFATSTVALAPLTLAALVRMSVVESLRG